MADELIDSERVKGEDTRGVMMERTERACFKVLDARLEKIMSLDRFPIQSVCVRQRQLSSDRGRVWHAR